MKNKYLKILLKPKEERSLWDQRDLLEFYLDCTPKEYKFAATIDYLFNTQIYGQRTTS